MAGFAREVRVARGGASGLGVGWGPRAGLGHARGRSRARLLTIGRLLVWLAAGLIENDHGWRFRPRRWRAGGAARRSCSPGVPRPSGSRWPVAGGQGSAWWPKNAIVQQKSVATVASGAIVATLQLKSLGKPDPLQQIWARCNLATAAYTRWRRLDFYRAIDSTMIAIVWSPVFVRLGNFINSEVLGTITNAPWGIVLRM